MFKPFCKKTLLATWIFYWPMFFVSKTISSIYFLVLKTSCSYVLDTTECSLKGFNLVSKCIHAASGFSGRRKWKKWSSLKSSFKFGWNIAVPAVKCCTAPSSFCSCWKISETIMFLSAALFYVFKEATWLTLCLTAKYKCSL